MFLSRSLTRRHKYWCEMKIFPSIPEKKNRISSSYQRKPPMGQAKSPHSGGGSTLVAPQVTNLGREEFQETWTSTPFTGWMSKGSCS